MTIAVDWPVGSITINQTDCTLVSGTFYTFDINTLFDTLKDLEDDVDGIVWPKTLNNTPPNTISGTTLARQLSILSPYTVEFLPDAQWSVQLEGANNNVWSIGDGILIQNQVQVIPTNSAGLIQVESADATAIDAKLDTLLTAQDLTNEQTAAQHTTDPATSKLILRNTTVMRRWEADAWEDAAKTVPYRGRIDGIEESGGLEAVDMLVEVAWS